MLTAQSGPSSSSAKHWPTPPSSAKNSTPSSELYRQYVVNTVFTTLSWSFHPSTSVRQSLLSSRSPVSLGGCSRHFTGGYPVSSGTDEAGGVAWQRAPGPLVLGVLLKSRCGASVPLLIWSTGPVPASWPYFGMGAAVVLQHILK